MIDLHLHTTASDGELSPAALIGRASEVGIHTLAVTDHDTMAGVVPAAAAAALRGLELLPGVELTATLGRRNIHLLAYFLDPSPPEMVAFLERQRSGRVTRARVMAERLRKVGAVIDERIIDRASRDGRSVARPLLARALVEAGHVRSAQEAFDRWLGDGRPAHVPCPGAQPTEVVRLVSQAGGIAGLAHPGLLGRDDLIAGLAQAGLAFLEAYHPEHGAAARSRYVTLADRYGLALSGGSDYHRDTHHRAMSFGSVGVPPAAFALLLDRLRQAHHVAHVAAR